MNNQKFPTVIVIACSLLLLLAGLSNGIMDTLQFHYGKSLFPKVEGETLLGQDREFWDPQISWKNKYRDYDAGDKRPAFWLSTTALVFLPAGHHHTLFVFSAYKVVLGTACTHTGQGALWHRFYTDVQLCAGEVGRQLNDIKTAINHY